MSGLSKFVLPGSFIAGVILLLLLVIVIILVLVWRKKWKSRRV